MAVSMSRSNGTWWVVVEGKGTVQIPCNLFTYGQHYS